MRIIILTCLIVAVVIISVFLLDVLIYVQHVAFHYRVNGIADNPVLKKYHVKEQP